MFKQFRYKIGFGQFSSEKFEDNFCKILRFIIEQVKDRELSGITNLLSVVATQKGVCSSDVSANFDFDTFQQREV